jgi:hypothetical protein
MRELSLSDKVFILGQLLKGNSILLKPGKEMGFASDIAYRKEWDLTFKPSDFPGCWRVQREAK